MDKQRLDEIKAELDRLAENDVNQLTTGFVHKRQSTYHALHPLVMCCELLKAYEQATTWQDIDTAPKGGQDILLWIKGENDSYRWVVGYWGKYSGAWVTDDIDEVSPTHWMPLPKPPVTEEG
jgi:hypothetical protein